MRSEEGFTQQPLALPTPLIESLPISYPITIWIVVFVAFVYWFFPVLMLQLLLAVGFGPRLIGAPTPEQIVSLTPLNLIASGLAFPLQIVSVVLLLPRFAGIRLDQLGLTWRGLARNCLRGVDGWQILTPICLALNFGILALYRGQSGSNVHEHPLVEWAHQGLSLGELLLLISAVSITAPVMEEMLFRGVLQTWLENRRVGAHFVMFLAFLASLPAQLVKLLTSFPLLSTRSEAWAQGGRELLLNCDPVLFIVALFLPYLLVYRLSRTSSWPALFAASTLFAAVHSFAWPSPVPLFVLALGLGWLAQRTRSLAGPIVLHGLFNALSCALLFWK